MMLFELFSLPFVQRSIIAGFLVALLCAITGMMSVLRGSALFGDALAHASLAGVATALLIGIHPLIGAFMYAILIALLLTVIKDASQLTVDNLIALILPVSMGLAVILLSFFSGYQPELISYLFGSILSVSWFDIAILAIISVIVLGIFSYYKDQLLFVFFDPEYAQISNIKVNKLNLIYNVLLALTVVVTIQVVGVILVNALLVIPTSIARLLARSMKSMLFFTPLISVIITFIGILVSFLLDIPTGPSIAVSAGVLFIMALISRRYITN